MYSVCVYVFVTQSINYHPCRLQEGEVALSNGGQFTISSNISEYGEHTGHACALLGMICMYVWYAMVWCYIYCPAFLNFEQ